MNSLNRIFSIFVFAAFAATSCFSTETDSEKTTQPTLFFEKNGIKVEFEKIKEPVLSNLYKYEVIIKITNSTHAPITIASKLFKNVSQSSLSKIKRIKNGAILVPLASVVAGLAGTILGLYLICKGSDNTKEQIIQPNQDACFISYISKNDFEKLEKGLLIPELDVKQGVS